MLYVQSIQVLVRFLAVAAALLGLGIIFYSPPTFSTNAASMAFVVSPFYYPFHVDGVLDEASSMAESWSPYWWLNSGGRFFLENGVGRTMQGSLPEESYWRKAYAVTSSRDTDGGYYPQNLFRLVTRSTWRNVQQEIYFRIQRLNMVESPHRNASNGVLLMSRYARDGQTLYYAGLRADGAAVIKKKLNGMYTTLAYNRLFAHDVPYNAATNPNLLPGGIWMGIRSRVADMPDGSVSITLFADKTGTGAWTEVARAHDTGSGGPPIRTEGYAGIRTDFMDVEFDNYRAVEL